ncbi:MAG: transglutaminase-like domain-containing protein [Pseudooceanicola sp.]
MPIEIDVALNYNLSGPDVLLVIEPAEGYGQAILSENLDTGGAGMTRIDGHAGVGRRLWINETRPQLDLRYRASVDVTRPAPRLEDLPPTPLSAMPGAALSALRPSRFCEADKFPAFVNRRFAGLSGGPMVAAIRDWVADEFAYVPGASHAMTTALDTFAMREGVCRDYTHIVCALCRAAMIPARYAAVYSPGVNPPDFHAVAQVWLDGAWHMVDATGMADPTETVLIAVGRDACDVAFMETATDAGLISMNVNVTRG